MLQTPPPARALGWGIMPTPPPAPALPQHFVDPSWVGEGATGDVWRVVDTEAGCVVALKIVRPHLAVHERFRARFAREVALAGSVLHPHVVAVRDWGTLADGRPWVAMDFADRGSLADALDQGMEPSEALPLLMQVLDALAHLHALGLVHQDLKPENILLVSTPDGGRTAWVTDLGVAGARTELALAKRGIAGTREWMAPEQLSGRPQELGPWTDLYAFGLILNEVYEGTPVPLRQDRGQPVRDRPRLPANVPAAMRELIHQLIDLRPYQRFDRAADVRRRMAAVRAMFEEDTAPLPTPEAILGGSTTTFTVPVLNEAIDPVTIPRRIGPPSAEVPRWNREPPGPLPADPPPVAPWLQPGQSPRLCTLREPPPAGREGERAAIWAAAREVLTSGGPQVVLLVGSAACGKAAVASSVARQLDAGGHMETFTLHYSAHPVSDDGYRGAVQEILAPWNDTPAEAERRISRWLARDQQTLPLTVSSEARALCRWCGFQGADQPPANAGLGLAYLYRHLDARSWRGGAMLVLENAHLSTQPGDGLAICRALLSRTVGERPVLVVATLEAAVLEADPELAATVTVLEELGARRVEVPRLSGDRLQRFLTAGLCLDPELAQDLHGRCGGSPVFASLLVRDWSTRGLLHWTDDGVLALPEGADPDVLVPSRIEQLCGRRVDGALAASTSAVRCAEALSAAALDGGRPPTAVARQVDLDGLDTLLLTGLVRSRGARLEFEHPVVLEEVLRRAEAQPDRQLIHQRLAQAWEDLGQSSGVDVDLDHGSHRLNAGEPRRGIAPLLRASRSALLSGRPGIARRAAELALQASAAAELRMAQVEARQRLAEALLELDLPQEAAELLDPHRQRLQMDRRSQARESLLRARAAIALGQTTEGLRLLEESERGYESTRDQPGLVETAHGKAIVFRTLGKPVRAAECFARMLELERGLNTRLELLAHAGRIEARLAAGQLRGLERAARRLRNLAQDSGDTRNIAQAHYTTGVVSLRLRRLDTAERHFRTALALATIQGDDRLEVSCENALGEVFRYSGDADAAQAAYRHAARVARRNGWDLVAAVSHMNLALLVLSSDPPRARALVQDAQACLSDHGTHWAWVFVGVLEALWAAEAGDFASCSRWLQRAESCGLGRLSSPDLWLPLERLASAAAARGWGELARQVDQALGMGPPISTPPVSLASDAPTERSHPGSAPVPSSSAVADDGPTELLPRSLGDVLSRT